MKRRNLFAALAGVFALPFFGYTTRARALPAPSFDMDDPWSRGITFKAVELDLWARGYGRADLAVPKAYSRDFLAGMRFQQNRLRDRLLRAGHLLRHEQGEYVEYFTLEQIDHECRAIQEGDA